MHCFYFSRIFFLSVAVLFLCSSTALAQPPITEFFPEPGFAQYDRELTEKTDQYQGERQQDRMESTSYEDGRIKRYERVGGTVRVYTSDLGVDESRERYIGMIVDALRSSGLPEDHVRQFQMMVERKLAPPPENRPLDMGDPETVREQLAGMPDDQKQWIGCYTDLYPEIRNKNIRIFEMEADESRFLPPDADMPPRYTVIRVSAENPSINFIDCEIMEKTVIYHETHEMEVSVSER